MDVVQIAKDRKEQFPCAVVGVDIAAGEEHFDEKNFPDLYLPHYQAMKYAKESGLNITLHAGEVGFPDNIMKAINKYGASRIGHGYRIADLDHILSKLSCLFFKDKKVESSNNVERRLRNSHKLCN